MLHSAGVVPGLINEQKEAQQLPQHCRAMRDVQDRGNSIRTSNETALFQKPLKLKPRLLRLPSCDAVVAAARLANISERRFCHARLASVKTSCTYMEGPGDALNM